jgi:hypothetical protein
MGPLDQRHRTLRRTPACASGADDPAARGGRAPVAGEEAHGVVNSAVALAKSGGAKTARASGLVNAVLRRIAEGGDASGPIMSTAALPGWIAGRSANPWVSRCCAPSKRPTRSEHRST